MTNLENPPLEAALIIIILLSAMMIGAGIIRRSSRGGAVDCARCGFKNPAGVKFCENCGESLKRLEPHA
jgi:rRNA maturation endonuclease Nob1